MTDPANELGKRLRQARNESRFTADEVAEFVGISRQQVYLHEGGALVKEKHLARYALLFKRPPEWLRYGETAVRERPVRVDADAILAAAARAESACQTLFGLIREFAVQAAESREPGEPVAPRRGGEERPTSRRSRPA